MPPLALVPAFAALALPAAAPADPLAGLTTRQLAGQRIVVGFNGPAIPAWLLERVRRGEIGGVILYTRNIVSRGALATRTARRSACSFPARPCDATTRRRSEPASGRARSL